MRKQPCSPKVGADIEHFIQVAQTEEIVPCVGILPGTKAEPYTPKGMNNNFAMQEDNVMAEYNIPPSPTGFDVSDSLDMAREMVDAELPAHLEINCETATHKFRPIELMSPQAKLIGCEPDQDAYKQGAMRTYCGKLGLSRSCGGHIHLGGDFNCPDWVAALFADYVIGVHGLCVPFREDNRTEWYGQPGIFRSKPYGIEYRTPNNQWTVLYSEHTANNAVGLANYLTKVDAEMIRNAMRSINWPRVRKFMTAGSPHQTQATWNEMEREFCVLGFEQYGMSALCPWDYGRIDMPAKNEELKVHEARNNLENFLRFGENA